MCCVCYLFFFMQKTAYEMRISDWSSDVCSSDLRRAAAAKLRLRTITFSQRCQVFLEPRALPRRAFDQLHQPFALASELVPFAPELHFLQLSQRPQPDRKSTRLNSSH